MLIMMKFNLWNGNQTTIDQEGSVQLYFKAQSSNVGFSTILELNKVSNGGEDVTLGINTLGRVELGIGTVSIASTTGEISTFTPNVGVADSLRPNGSYSVTNATLVTHLDMVLSSMLLFLLMVHQQLH